MAALLIHRAIGDRLTCIFVDNGAAAAWTRRAQVRTRFERLQLPLDFVDASDLFLDRLAGVTDPGAEAQDHRRRRSSTSSRSEATELGGFDFLAQGTLYPDVIEIVSVVGPSAAIKSHHNVGGLPERMRFKLVEPLRELFKDEVRAVGTDARPRRGVRVAPAVPRAGPRRADPRRGHAASGSTCCAAPTRSSPRRFEARGWYRRLWQSFAVLLPVQSVGVMGDARTYEYTIAIRAVESRDGMTADWARLPHDLLGAISSRIVNEVQGHQPRRVRHQLEAAVDDRVGIVAGMARRLSARHD